MSIPSIVFIVLAVIAAFVAGFYLGVGKMMSDAYIHNRVLASHDPVGIHRWLRMTPEMSMCYGVMACCIALMFAFMLA